MHKLQQFSIYSNLIRCTDCDQIFLTKRALKIHTQRRHEIEEKLIECDVCKISVQQKSLRMHKRGHKNDPPDSSNYYQFIADMSCDQCTAKFASFHDARQHYKDIHNDDNGYIKCCGKKLRKPYLVNDHIKTHSNSETIKYVSMQYIDPTIFRLKNFQFCPKKGVSCATKLLKLET